MSDPRALVQKLWNYCNVLRDDGLSYGDYVEQLTYLLFLKMADEQTKPPFNRDAVVPYGLDWQSLLDRDGDELEAHDIKILNDLGRSPGMLGVIFRKAQNRIQDPAKLRRLVVDLIDQERWMSLDTDVKGDAYEGLLQKNAEDLKSGAGQYFTPRPLIRAIVEVMRPEPGTDICDPACGTGGFLLAAHDYIVDDNPYLDPTRSATCASTPCRAGRSSTTRPASVRPEVIGHRCGRRRRDSPGGPDGRAGGLLGDDVQQAAQLRPARQDPAQDRGAGRGRRS